MDDKTQIAILKDVLSGVMFGSVIGRIIGVTTDLFKSLVFLWL